MNLNSHIDHLLSDYLDGSLAAEEQAVVARHLAGCPACREAYVQQQALVAALGALPRRIEPPNDLWEGIAAQLEERAAAPAYDLGPPLRGAASAVVDRPVSPRGPSRKARLLRAGWRQGAAVLAVLLIAIGWWYLAGRAPAWTVTPLAGAPAVGPHALTAPGALRVGEWLETDAASRARLAVGRIGSVELAPNTRLRFEAAGRGDHRLSLARGRIHARIDAPPRQFFVETPAGLAVDLGCEYTLAVDAGGASLLHVRAGYVGFSRATREVIVPAGWMVRARPDAFPGTPFHEAAPPALREALRRFDFEGGGAGALAVVLAEVQARDALTLWELLYRTEGPAEELVYDRLAALVEPPPGTTRAGTLARRPEMVQAWRKKLGVDVTYWLAYAKKRKQATR